MKIETLCLPFNLEWYEYFVNAYLYTMCGIVLALAALDVVIFVLASFSNFQKHRIT